MSGFEKDIRNLQEYRRNLDVTTKSMMMSKQDLHKVLRHIMATTNLINALKAQQVCRDKGVHSSLIFFVTIEYKIYLTKNRITFY